MPVVHLYTVCWNDVRILPFFLQHYRPFVERFVIYDDGSDDGTREYLEQQPDVEVRPFMRGGAQSLILAGHAFYETVWMESRGKADWVMVPDVDEFLHHPRMRSVLRNAIGKWTLLGASGFEMVSSTFPVPSEPLIQQIRRGLPRRGFCKSIVFDPDAIETIGFAPGRHTCTPSGDVRDPPRPLLRLFHYKHLGWDYLQARQAELAARLLAIDREKGFGHQYNWNDLARRAFFDLLDDAALDVVKRRIPRRWERR